MPSREPSLKNYVLVSAYYRPKEAEVGISLKIAV